MPSTRFTRAVFSTLTLALLASTCAAAEPASCDYGKGDVVPLRFLPSGLPVLDGSLNGQPAAFLLDTGAGQTYVLRPKLEAMKTFVMPSMSSASGIGGQVKRSITRLKTMDFGPVHVDKPYLFVMDNLHPSLAGQFDAILGMEDLAANDFEVDIAAGKLTIFKGRCAKDAAVAWAPDAIDLPLNQGRPDTSPAQFTVSIGGRPTKAFFDTGAKLTTLDTKVAELLGVERKPDGEVNYAIGAGMQRTAMWSAAVKDLVVGKEKSAKAALEVGPLNGGASGNELLIGLDYLKNHRLLFLPAQERFLVKAVAPAQ